MTHPFATRRTRELHDGWSVRGVAGPLPAYLSGRDVPASVPGCVHTDLLAAGLIDDPYLDDNEHLLAWIGRCDWAYRTTFAWPAADTAGSRHDLAFDGLDTVASITLNGTDVGRTANQHRVYRFDVTGLLRDGDNTLTVDFASPVRYADAQSLALGYRPQVNHHPFNAIRKSACNFGWDWGIDAPTVGIWRPVRLESWTAARLAAVRPLATAATTATDPTTSVGRLAVHVEVERQAGVDGSLDVDVSLGGHGAEVVARTTIGAGATTTVVHLDVPDARLWWPRGYGAQPLYAVDVTLTAAGAADPTPLDTWSGRVGFRSVRLEMGADEQGTPFTLVVNDRPVWVKGANWIPDDTFVHRVTRERYAQRLDQAERANLNLLRVWGGGIYEADDFYDLCDERGILTWQDFAFACAAYSEDEPLRSEVEAEARDNVIRLAPHPSLVLWNGSNENIWGYHEWNWRLRLDGKTWGLGYYTDLLPRIVAELDGTRPYTPSSPWSGALDIDANDPDHGSMHSWDVWNRLDWQRYRDTVPRFMAEFGWQGPPTWATLTRAIGDDPLTPESPGMLVHQKAIKGNDKLTDGLLAHLPLPDDMADWHWAMSWNQAVAVQVAVEHLRSWDPRCRGSVMWQLNDSWPVTSWAAVDGDGRPKPLLYALAHAHADRLVTVQPRGAGLVVAVANDTDEVWSGDLVVRRLSFDGAEIAAAKTYVDVVARETAAVTVPASVYASTDPASEVLVASLGDLRGLWFFAEPRHSALAAPRLTTDVRAIPGGYAVHIAAENLVRDIALLVDKVHADARVDDMLVTLLPDETVEFRVATPDGVVLDADDLVADGVLRSLNQLVRADAP